jgi:hypothetical protein
MTHTSFCGGPSNWSSRGVLNCAPVTIQHRNGEQRRVEFPIQGLPRMACCGSPPIDKHKLVAGKVTPTGSHCPSSREKNRQTLDSWGLPWLRA